MEGQVLLNQMESMELTDTKLFKNGGTISKRIKKSVFKVTGRVKSPANCCPTLFKKYSGTRMTFHGKRDRRSRGCFKLELPCKTKWKKHPAPPIQIFSKVKER